MDKEPASPFLLEEAVAIAKKAGKITLPWFQSTSLQIEQKIDGTPVTEADRAAEVYIREYLEEAHPNDTVIGEEYGIEKGSSDLRWIIDPIDGTKSFTRGVPLYSTLLAVEDQHGPAIGVIYLPGLEEVVFAGRGLGCFANEAPTSVSKRTITHNNLCVTTSGLSAWSDQSLTNILRSGIHFRTWGDGYGYSLVATGRIDAMIDPQAELWDLAPMPVIIEEAGGCFTDIQGKPGADRGSGLATNGCIHQDILQIL